MSINSPAEIAKNYVTIGKNKVNTPIDKMFLLAVLAGAFSCGIDRIPQNIAIAPNITLPLIIGMGLLTCISPYFLYTLALKKIPAGTATSLGIIEPMAATLFSVMLFSEPLSKASLCGIVLILGAVFMLSKSDEEKSA